MNYCSTISRVGYCVGILAMLVLVGNNVAFAKSLEKANLFAHDVGVIWGYYNSSLATIDYCEGSYNSNVARNLFMSNNKRIFDDANQLLVKRFGLKLANMMIQRVRSDSSIYIQLDELKRMSAANRQYACADFLRQHMNRERDIKNLFSGQMKRVFGVKRFLY